MTAFSDYVMPFSNVSHLPLDGKLRAARLAGFSKMSLMPVEVEHMLASGLTPSDIVSRAADQGVRITRLDPLNTWPRIWLPDNMDEAYIRTVDTTPDRFFELCEALGCTHASLNATFPMNSMPRDEIVAHYAAICKRAAEHGLVCDLEFIPLWGVPTLAMGWDIVRSADAPNGGMVFDVWHFVRSKSDIQLLREIPGDKIHCVQLNDGPIDLPAGVTVKDNCYDRKFPGDGEFPNVEIIAILAKTGGLNEVGPEVFSPMLKSMTAEEVAAKSRLSTLDALRAAGVDI